ncbi:MAG: S8 family serine peptidase [Halobacteriota archaeon]
MKKSWVIVLAIVILFTVAAIPVIGTSTDMLDINVVADQNHETFRSHISGREYELVKNIPAETIQYRDKSGNVYRTKHELFDHELTELSIDANLLKLDEDLRAIAKSEERTKTVPVILVFAQQPAHDISIKVNEFYEPELKNITAQAKKVYGRIKPLLREEELHAMNLSAIVNAEQALLTTEEKRVLNETGIKLEWKATQMRQEILASAEPEVEVIQAPIIYELERNGCRIKYKGIIYNSITADVPVSYLDELVAYPSIAMVYYDKVLNATLNISTKAIGADFWWDQGYRGGIWDVAVVDTGIDDSHPALTVDSAKVFHRTAKYESDYDDDPSNPNDLLGHGTFCAGIIASEDPGYKGVAYGLDKLISAKASYLGTDGRGYIALSDSMEAIDWAIFHCSDDDADVISYSYGGNPGADGDVGLCHYMDAVVFNLNTPVITVAGNSGPYSKTIGEPGSAYNVITVGSIDDKETVSRNDDSISERSSRGPTKDGRTKPDVVAPGVGIMSCNNEWETQDNFVSGSGTSFAAPHVTGSVLLILDYKGVKWDTKAIKALLLNTAEDKGAAGPDNTYGFGYVDLRNAYIHRDDVHVDSLKAKPEGKVEKFYKGPVNEGDRATLVWNRDVIYNDAHHPTQYPDLSDLDLYLFNEADNMEIDSSLSSKNNVEQVKSNAYYSSAIIKIEPYCYPAGIESEECALATEGNFSEVAPPELSANLSIPNFVSSGSSFSASLTVTNRGDIKVHGVNATLNHSSGFTIVSGANPHNLGIINAGESKTVTWTVKASSVSSSQIYTMSTNVDSYSYGESYSAGDLNRITVTPAVTIPSEFDTGSPINPYPSIYGTHTGTIQLNQTITGYKLYTYSCAGTGGHTEYARIWNDTWSGEEGYWKGYKDDWHNVTFNDSFTLFAKNIYYYEIRTSSYPQIHHTAALLTAYGWINCTEFTDSNGKRYYDWIPAIKLELE